MTFPSQHPSARLAAAGTFAAMLAMGVALAAQTQDARSADTSGAEPRTNVTQPALARSVRLDSPAALGVGTQLPDVTFRTIQGRTVTLSQALRGKRGAVIAMTAVTCPLSRKYAPRLAQLERDYEQRGVAFLFVNTIGIETDAEIRGFIRENQFRGPYAPDRDQPIAIALNVRTTTEMYVVDSARTLVYRGALDDQFGVGTAAAAPRAHFVRDALDAVLVGQRPVIRATWAPGCLVELPAAREQREAPARAQEPYFPAIARIIQTSCIECHRSGGPAPFSLEHEGSVLSRAKMIEAVVRDDLMPPWHARGPTRYANARALTEPDKARLLAWLAGPRELGNPADAPRSLRFGSTWNIGQPDEVWVSEGARIEARSGLRRTRVTVSRGDVDASAPLLVGALEVAPMMRDAMHHAILWIADADAAVRADDVSNLTFLTASSPGDGAWVLPPDRAMEIPHGSRIVADVYHRSMETAMTDRLRLAVRGADASAPLRVRNITLPWAPLELSAGERGAGVSTTLELREATEVGAVRVIARARAVRALVEATLPNGDVVELLHIPAYDFRWQTRYELLEPELLPAGAVVRATVWYDNSDQNPANPDPGATVRDGWEGADEVLLCVLETLDVRAAPQTP